MVELASRLDITQVFWVVSQKQVNGKLRKPKLRASLSNVGSPKDVRIGKMKLPD